VIGLFFLGVRSSLQDMPQFLIGALSFLSCSGVRSPVVGRWVPLFPNLTGLNFPYTMNLPLYFTVHPCLMKKEAIESTVSPSTPSFILIIVFCWPSHFLQDLSSNPFSSMTLPFDKHSLLRASLSKCSGAEFTSRSYIAMPYLWWSGLE